MSIEESGSLNPEELPLAELQRRLALVVAEMEELQSKIPEIVQEEIERLDVVTREREKLMGAILVAIAKQGR